jgi:hypothetical protein
MTLPVITVAVPSYNQGQYIEEALESIFKQDLPVEVFVLDGGSTDGTVEILKKWSSRLSGWRSGPDDGQAAAINDGVKMGTAPYVCWLNSDDYWLPGQLNRLLEALEQDSTVPMVYGRVENFDENTGRHSSVWVESFDEKRLAKRCIISQPATLIRRDVWQKLSGLRAELGMAMDYDLWWRIYRQFGKPKFVDELIAVNRQHNDTKTQSQRHLHYREAIEVVRTHAGYVPLKWWLYQPYSVWVKAAINWYRKR